MIARNIENGGNLPLVLAMAHKAPIAAPAERKRKGIQQDGFARARLARQHRQAGIEGKVQPFDQDDIADRNLDKHGLFVLSRRREGFWQRG